MPNAFYDLHETHRRGGLAELLVAYRFLEAGRVPARPIVPRSYDLLVDAGSAIYRVQVKQAHESLKGWTVALTSRRVGKTDLSTSCVGCEYLAIICTPDRIYIIPTAACVPAHAPDRMFARLTIYTGPTATRFAPYLNNFNVGTGRMPPPPVPLGPLPPRGMWFSATAGTRKTHRHLTLDQIAEIRQLPIRWFKKQGGEGLLPIEDVAAQFGVHPATIRNLLRGKRQDLQKPSGD